MASMESRIKELYETILQKREQLLKKVELFGEGDMMVINAFRELEGMEEAFKFVSGMDTVDYMLKDMEG